MRNLFIVYSNTSLMDFILKKDVKIGLPLLRLSTDGSSEKERIVGALEQAMQQG